MWQSLLNALQDGDPGYLLTIWFDIRTFMDMGGQVLMVLFALTLLLWTLVIERYLFFSFSLPKLREGWLLIWTQRPDNVWLTHQIRVELLSLAKSRANANLPLIKTLIALCPMLGLLGTVAGMIQVFDVLSVTGTGNPRGMADGISKATIPTMAGMVASLSGLYFSASLQRKSDRHLQKLRDLLSL